MLKKIGLLCCLLLLLQTHIPQKNLYAASILSLEDVIKRGLKQDQDLKDLQENLNQKKYEQTQAQQAIQDQADRDASSVAKPHSLSKDIDLAMKIPTARGGYSLAMSAVEDKQRQVTANITKLYIKTFQAMRVVPKVQLKLDAANKALKDTQTKLKFGIGTQDDVKEAEKAIEQANSELKLMQLDYKNSKIELGEIIGQNLEQDDFIFEVKPTYAKLSQSLIWQLIHLAEKTDMELLTNVSSRKLAEEKVNSTRNLYASKFGSGVMVPLNSLYNAQTVDSELLTTYYDQLLVDVKQQWGGNFLFPIPVTPFVMPIPKSMLQGEYDGLRYFDDIKYSLPISTLAMNKARATESQTRKSLILKIKKTYLDTKTAEENYAQALKAAEEVKLSMKAADKKLKTGILSKEEYIKLQEATETINDNVVTNQLSYQAALTQLDLDTSGALDRNIVPGILPWKTIDSGLDPLNKVPPVANPVIGSWSLKTIADNLTVDFSIKVDKNLKATHYALLTSDNQLIGSKLKLTSKIRHLSFMFNDPSKLKVVLYKKDTIIATALIDGLGAKGDLLQGDKVIKATDIKPSKVDKEAGTLLIGTYKINLEKLTNASLLAAQETMKKTGQGMYYKSEFSSGAWIGIDKVTDMDSINTSTGAKPVKASEIEQLKFTVVINDVGQIASVQTPEELQSALAELIQEQQQLKVDNTVAIAANKAETAASLSLQLKEIEAQIAFTQALIKGDADEAAKQMAIMNTPAAALSALPSNTAEASAAAKADLNSELAELTANLQQAQTNGDATLTEQLKLSITSTSTQIMKLQQSMDEAAKTNLAQSQAADAALADLQTEKTNLQNSLKQANEQGKKELTKQLQQQLNELSLKITAAEEKSEQAQIIVAQDNAAKQGVVEIPVASDETKLAELDKQLALIEEQIKQAQQKSDKSAVQELQLNSLQLEMDKAIIDSGLGEQIAVFEAAQLSLQKLADEAVKKGDSASFDELKKLKASNDIALQLALKSELFLNKANLEDSLAELKANGQANPLIEAEIIKITNQIVDNEKSKYSKEQLQKLAQLTKEIQTATNNQIQVLPVEKLISQGINIPLELPPVIIKGTTYITVRPLSEAFKSTVVWDDSDQTVTITNDQTTIICQIDNPIASVNGNEVRLTEPPRLLEHRTIVPLRFIVESLGLTIAWQDLTQTIEISGL
ncbi:hypothetical protein EHS13_18005 [Paenibacillus psychroresistens]|uniref:Copper amine oxidase-like N-terminal domain-containing protein n=1 Tax=Paenibacillus psychroresistens TaxID=1778678 RepID=A0A6B8RLJ8_9BACL|nr:stalk domain-containing protein [Paenibacillus psychroresistens]QGQ96634.1 hypothetical protein EHS13_18005 [Paenibacillus psychroresistens]